MRLKSENEDLKKALPKKLYDAQISFVSLPNGKDIDDVVADIFLGLNGEIASGILLKTIGAFLSC
ncbi:MAG: hypothetical protein OEW48_04835 [Phycisphaerae bacterium]|nr:hypothetical protein [Phycisphaerae bacterium]